MVLRPPAAPGGQLRFLGGQLQHVGGEARDLAPGHRAVGALPQTGLARAQEQDATVVGIDGHALAVAATRFVAAELDGDVGALERTALIRGAQDRPVGNVRRGVRAAREVDLGGIRGIHGDALDAHQIEVGVGNPVEHRLPAAGLRIAPVRAAHVRARVEHVLGGGMEDEPVDEPAADDGHALPGVSRRHRRGLRRGGGRQRREREQAGSSANRLHRLCRAAKAAGSRSSPARAGRGRTGPPPGGRPASRRPRCSSRRSGAPSGPTFRRTRPAS